MGVELLNDDGPAADAELIALVVSIMQTAGLTEFQVSVGQVDYFDSLVEEAGMDEDTVEELNTILSPVLARRLEAKLWQALYYDYEFAQPFLPQLERNLRWLEGECAKLRGYQEQLSTKCIEKNDR